MKILVDENIPAMTVLSLRELGHEVKDIRSTESDVLSFANSQMSLIFPAFYSKVWSIWNCGEGNMKTTVRIPREILWDYTEAPDDLLWKLQRIADFFPAYGADRETVALLYENRDRLKLEEGKYRLIGMYHEVWNEKTRADNR